EQPGQAARYKRSAGAEARVERATPERTHRTRESARGLGDSEKCALATFAGEFACECLKDGQRDRESHCRDGKPKNDHDGRLGAGHDEHPGAKGKRAEGGELLSPESSKDDTEKCSLQDEVRGAHQSERESNFLRGPREAGGGEEREGYLDAREAQERA